MKKAFLAAIAVFMVFTVNAKAQDYIFGPGYYGGSDPGYNIWELGYWTFEVKGTYLSVPVTPTPPPVIDGQTLKFNLPGTSTGTEWTATFSTNGSGDPLGPHAPPLPAITPGEYFFSFDYAQTGVLALGQTFELTITNAEGQQIYFFNAFDLADLINGESGFSGHTFNVLAETDYLNFEFYIDAGVSGANTIVISEIALSKKTDDPYPVPGF